MVHPTHEDSAGIVFRLQREMLEQKRILEEQLESGAITAEAFAHQVNGLLTATLKRASELLPPEDFNEHFGFQYKGETAVLIDPKSAAASANEK